MPRFLDWIRSLFVARQKAPRAAPVVRDDTARTATPAKAERAQHDTRAPQPASALPARTEGAHDAPAQAPTPEPEPVFHDRDQALFDAISAQITEKRFELPQLPSTSVAVIDLASKPSTEVADIVKLIQSDPVLSSELLKTANSVMYGGQQRTETISAGVVRIGIKNLRSMILSISMRGVVFHDKALANYAQEIWRQSSAMAAISRAIGKKLGFDAERAFLIGLLADIGKVSLLAMMRGSGRKGSEATPVVIARVFTRFHEVAGAALARAWRLPEEIVSVAGTHHDYENNTEFPRSAALASLAQRLYVQLMTGDEEQFWAAARAPEFDFLHVDESARREILDAAIDAWRAHAPAPTGAQR